MAVSKRYRDDNDYWPSIAVTQIDDDESADYGSWIVWCAECDRQTGSAYPTRGRAEEMVAAHADRHIEKEG